MTTSMSLTSSNNMLAERLQIVRDGISKACAAEGRDSADVTLIVVTKFHPVSTMRELFALGVRDFGENRHQEAERKAEELQDLEMRLHFIGQLQSNKAAAVRRYADVVHSVDRPALVTALGKASAEPIECFLQLNLTDDPGRGGVAPSELSELAELAAATASLRVMGVMAVAPLQVDPRQAFVKVRECSEALRAIIPEAVYISAGMSYDYAEAIAEGATHLRIGTAITGERPPTS
jgi:pyridoxal phosphate enzyme (YggS family)